MKHIGGIVLIFCLMSPAFSQSAEEEVVRLKSEGQHTELDENQIPREEKKGGLGLSMGTSYSWMQGYGSVMGYSIMPTYTYPLSSKWALHGGLIASTYYGLNQIPVGEGIYGNPSMSSLALFGAASYKMTDRLVLHGAGVKQLLSMPGQAMPSYSVDNLSLGATYHFGNNFSIGASVHFRNGPSYGSFYGGPHYGSFSPFGW